MSFRLIGFLGTAIAFAASGSAGTVGAAERPRMRVQAADTRSDVPAAHPPGAYRAALFVTLPMTNGFADATDALVEARALVHEALEAVETVRLVNRLQDSDAVLTVLGRGTGYLELTEHMKSFDRSVVASPVLLDATERYIQAMLTVGSCGEAATNATMFTKPASCYRMIFVGLGLADRDARQSITRPARNSWKACADALARDVHAWVVQNASRLHALRG